MLLVTFCLVMSLPLARNQKAIDGPTVCGSTCGFGAHVHFEASLNIKGKQIQIPDDADVSLECNTSAPDVQKIKIVWVSLTPLPTSTIITITDLPPKLALPKEVNQLQTESTPRTEGEALFPASPPITSTPSNTEPPLTESTVTIMTTQNDESEVISKSPARIGSETTTQTDSSEDEGNTSQSSFSDTTTDSVLIFEGASTESSTMSTEAETATTSQSSFTSISTELSTLSSNYDLRTSMISETGTEATISDATFESTASVYPITDPRDSDGTVSSYYSTTTNTYDSGAHSTALGRLLEVKAAEPVTEDPYESSGEAEYDSRSITDTLGESLLEFLRASSDEVLLFRQNSHLERFHRDVFGRSEHLTEGQPENKLELWFKNGSTTHYLSKIAITLQSDVTGDSTIKVIIPLCEKRMEAAYDYVYKCSSEEFDLGDSSTLLLQNIAVVAFSDDNCTFNRSKLCGEKDFEGIRSLNGVIIASALLGGFAVTGILWITCRKWIRRIFRPKRPAAVL